MLIAEVEVSDDVHVRLEACLKSCDNQESSTLPRSWRGRREGRGRGGEEKQRRVKERERRPANEFREGEGGLRTEKEGTTKGLTNFELLNEATSKTPNTQKCTFPTCRQTNKQTNKQTLTHFRFKQRPL